MTEWFTDMESERIEVKTRRKTTVNKTKRNDIKGTVRQEGVWAVTHGGFLTAHYVLITLQIFLFNPFAL